MYVGLASQNAKHEDKRDHLFNLKTTKPSFIFNLGHGLLEINGDKVNEEAC